MFARLQLFKKKHYKTRAIDLNQQQALDSDTREIQQINFTGNLSDNNNISMFYIIDEAKETIIDFSQVTVKVWWMLLYNLARIAKVFDRTACSKILIYFNIMSIYKITQFITLNVQFSYLQLNKLKSEIKKMVLQ